jgi:hypothetical protein
MRMKLKDKVILFDNSLVSQIATMEPSFITVSILDDDDPLLEIYRRLKERLLLEE